MSTQYIKKFIESLRKQIAQGEIELVLDQVQNYLSSNSIELRDEAILLSARYNRLRRDERKGIITRDTAQSEQNKLANSLLELLGELPFKVSKDFYPAFTPPAAIEDLAIPQEVRLEKILGVNNLKQISWLERGLKVSKSICRILTPEGLGTGFMIGSGLVMTNNHVIPDQRVASQSFAEFNYQNNLEGNMLPTCRYKLDKGRFHTDISLDYTIVGVSWDPPRPELECWGHVFLNSYADPVPGEHVIIVQHPVVYVNH